MTCQDAERRIQESLGSEPQAVDLQHHLQACRSCASLAAATQGLDTLFERLGPKEPNPFLWSRIEVRLKETARPARRRYLPWLEPAWLAAAFLLIFSCLVGTLNLPGSSDETLQTSLVDVGLPSGVNPFLVAQARSVETSNPFLEAMTPRGGNPFAASRVQ